MKISQFKVLLFSFALLNVLAVVGASPANAAYYYGSYDQSGSGSDNSAAPDNVPAQAPPPQAPPPDQQPPVVYREVPVYRRAPVYREPAYASSNSAALAPWPWNFDFGGGPTAIAGSNSDLTSGSNFEFGGGYNFSPQAGWVLEFMNDRLGVSDSAIQRDGAIDGDAYVWGVTLNPIWRFRITGPIGGYLIGGGGYYNREERFDVPVQVFVPTFHGGFFETGTETDRQYTDAGGVNIGGGLTWNFGWGTKLFVEARYHYIFTSGKATQIVPVTFGLRW